jgi:hypothetical protein
MNTGEKILKTKTKKDFHRRTATLVTEKREAQGAHAPTQFTCFIIDQFNILA